MKFKQKGKKNSILEQLTQQFLIKREDIAKETNYTLQLIFKELNLEIIA